MKKEKKESHICLIIFFNYLCYVCMYVCMYACMYVCVCVCDFVVTQSKFGLCTHTYLPRYFVIFFWGVKLGFLV